MTRSIVKWIVIVATCSDYPLISCSSWNYCWSVPVSPRWWPINRALQITELYLSL